VASGMATEGGGEDGGEEGYGRTAGGGLRSEVGDGADGCSSEEMSDFVGPGGLPVTEDRLW